jgi:hypothetical protein
MSYRCANPDCAYAETGVCARRIEFANPEEQCEDLRAGRDAAPDSATEKPISLRPEPDIASNVELPQDPGRFWSGFALGAEEAGSMLWDPAARLFTLMGGKDRGKTSFLTAVYILLANGFVSGFPYRFCGSRSLHGFQRLADPAIKWKGGEERVVPRTTQATYRQPSFLHLAFKERGHDALHVTNTLLTDMPGEWFERWGDGGASALPETLDFLPRTDGFIVVLDASRALTDRTYRKEVRYLLDRTIALCHESPIPQRPVALVLTKYDMIAAQAPIPGLTARKDPEGWGPLTAALRSLVTALKDLPEGTPWDIFPTAAFSRPSAQPVGVLSPLAFLLRSTTKVAPTQPSMALPRNFDGDFFRVFREDAT